MMNLIEILKENCLMKTPSQINIFETTLEKIAHHPQAENLPEYHLIFHDQCEQPEVMFGLIHFLESFEIEIQIKAFIQVIPQLMIQCPEWTRIIHNRIINDELSCKIYQQLLHSINQEKPHFLYYLLQESAINKLKSQPLLS